MVAVGFADSQNTWVCLIELLLITRRSPVGGCRKDPRGFEEAVVAPERALEMVWDDSRCSLKYQKLLLKTFSPVIYLLLTKQWLVSLQALWAAGASVCHPPCAWARN